MDPASSWQAQPFNFGEVGVADLSASPRIKECSGLKSQQWCVRLHLGQKFLELGLMLVEGSLKYGIGCVAPPNRTGLEGEAESTQANRRKLGGSHGTPIICICGTFYQPPPR